MGKPYLMVFLNHHEDVAENLMKTVADLTDHLRIMAVEKDWLGLCPMPADWQMSLSVITKLPQDVHLLANSQETEFFLEVRIAYSERTCSVLTMEKCEYD